MIDQLMPYGFHRLFSYRERFRRLSLPTRFALSRSHRLALEVTRLELLPKRFQFKSIVDVGANVGNWSTGMMLLSNPELIVAFEPLPKVYNQLKQNTQKFHQITTINAAVGSFSGTITINEEKQSELSSILPMSETSRKFHYTSYDEPEPSEVVITTLDDALADLPEISLLKLDVQGYEYDVLQGAASVLQRTRVLMTEVLYSSSYYLGAKLCTDLFQVIKEMSGMQLWGISEPHCDVDGTPIWADAVFVAE